MAEIVKINLSKSLDKILEEYSEELINNTEIATDEMAEILVQELERNSPGNGIYRKNFVIKKYGLTKFVGNTTKTKEGLPLSNILEFGAIRLKKGIMLPQPHFEVAVKHVENKILNILVKRIEK